MRIERTPIYTLEVTAPLSISVNAAYAQVIKTNKYGQRYTRRIGSQALKTFKKSIYDILLARKLLNDPRWEQAEEIGFEAVVYVRRRNADMTNYIKTYEDGIAEALRFNDKRVVRAYLDKAVDAKCPRIEGHWYIYR